MKIAIQVLLAFTASVHALGQPFQNLGFDEANTNNIVLAAGPDGPMGSGPIADLVPGWQLWEGTQALTTMNLNVWPEKPPGQSLIQPPRLDPFIEGPYALMFSALPEALFSISQRGDVPPDACILSFKCDGQPFLLTIDSQLVNPGSGPATNTGFPQSPWFNISAFRGKNVELKLAQMPLPPNFDTQGFGIFSEIDTIQFRNASKADFWFQRDTGGSTAALYGAAAGDGGLVAVGTGGAILWSADGQRWLPQPKRTTNDLFSVVFSNGLWVVVGDRRTILTSPDGHQWTVRLTDTTTSITNAPVLSKVIHAQGLFVAVGGQKPFNPCGGLLQASIWTSPDGMTWTDRSPPPLGLFCIGVLSDVIYTPEKQAFVAGPGVLASTDGIVWSPLQGGNQPNASSIVYGNGQFIAAGEVDGVYTSTNALNWTKIAGLEGYAASTAAYFDGAFWLGGSTEVHGLTTPALVRSTDAKVWSPVDASGFPNNWAIRRLSVVGESLLVTGITYRPSALIVQSASITAPSQFRAWETHFQTNGSLALALDAPPGSILSVDSSTDLKSWSLLQVVTNTTTRVDVTDPGAKGAGKRFYRAKTE